jgi:hypothetical protein
MMLAWRAMIPMSLALLLGTALVIYFYGAGPGRDQMLINGNLPVILLVTNVVIMALIVIVSMLVPAAPPTNRKIALPDSRYKHTPVAPSARLQN